jgi:hypothetical protein
MTRWVAAALLFVAGMGVAPMAMAGQPCWFAWRAFAEGSVSCQSGRQFRCVNQTWQEIGTTCADVDPRESGAQVRPGVNAPLVKQPAVEQPAPPRMDRSRMP